jgi:hypothetical protein
VNFSFRYGLQVVLRSCQFLGNFSLTSVLYALLVAVYHAQVHASFFLVSWGGVKLGSFGPSATNWPIVPAPNDTC